MYVYRGRVDDRERDRAATAAMLERAGARGEPALRVWTPARQVAFGRRDAREPGYEAARAAAAERGYPSIERSVGGRAVAYAGSTLAFAHAIPDDDPRASVAARYDDAVGTVLAGVDALGVDAERGEPPGSFCPGDYSVQVAVDGRPAKVAGIAQRVTADAALVAGVVVPVDRDDLRDVLTAVYDALDVPFDPGTVGSVAAAGGPGGPDAPGVVARALEAAFVDDRPTTVASATGLVGGDDDGDAAGVDATRDRDGG